MTVRPLMKGLTILLGAAIAVASVGCGPDAGLTQAGADTAAGNKAAADPLLTGTPDMKKQLKSAKASGKASGVPAGMPGMAPPSAPPK